MIKPVLALLLLSVTSFTQAVEFKHEIDIFNPVNFLKATTPLNLIQSFLNQNSGDHLLKGQHVVFSTCAVDVQDDYLNNPTQTFTKPDPIGKGLTIDFNFGGLFMQATEVTDVYIYVLWNNSFLYQEDHPMDQKIEPRGAFTYTLSWAVPSFAPSGHYEVTITVKGKVGNEDTVVKVGCIDAQFDL